ncbi:hypothetical protein SAMN02745673_04357 [Marinactinospora thermotolerans DSM 45154]|uniref:DUF4352 domain-containing protein n=1 Tax=Marinactinospora thermotolerans DSM 45154 TaxID=1122192 RepID=A0A1T4T332_9ACTN|nr:hypothetical protein SAMN02745673_04357 [Marinactinospora thermotolerans DSM 45154]
MLRAAAAGVFALTVAALLFALWLSGGLERAREDVPLPPGTAVRNDLLTITVHGAEIASAGSGGLGGPSVTLRAELTSHADEPVSTSFFIDMLEVRTEPSGSRAEGYGSITLERAPADLLTHVQPEMPETVLVELPLAEGARPDGDGRVRVTVKEAEFRPGFADESSYWWSTDEVAGEVAVTTGLD